MRKFIFYIAIFFSLPAYANWDAELSKHSLNKKTQSDRIILEQYQAYQNNRLPKIADPVIKNIPINESWEPLVNINEQSNPRLIMLPNPTTSFEAADKNSGLPYAQYVRRSLFKKLIRLIAELDLLAPQFGYKPGQVSIKIFEGLRDIETQNKLFEAKAQEIQANNPNFSQEQVYVETTKWVSPTKNNIPAHSTGAAVDLRLYDNIGAKFIDMGKFGVIWGPNESAPTYFAALNDEQISNRLFLILAAARAYLVNYPYEYWHFSTGDRYAIYWLQPIPLEAKYGIANPD